MAPRPWNIVESEAVQECAVFRVHRTLSRSPRDGEVHAFYQIEADTWVNIVPVTDAGEIVMVRQYRHGSREVTLEIPGGIVDPGESVGEAAARELLEETGYQADDVESIGVVNPNPALFSNGCHTYFSRGVKKVADIRNESTEETAVQLVPEAEISQLLREGVINHALVIAGLYWYRLHQDRAKASG